MSSVGYLLRRSLVLEHDAELFVRLLGGVAYFEGVCPCKYYCFRFLGEVDEVRQVFAGHSTFREDNNVWHLQEFLGSEPFLEPTQHSLQPVFGPRQVTRTAEFPQILRCGEAICFKLLEASNCWTEKWFPEPIRMLNGESRMGLQLYDGNSEFDHFIWRVFCML